jgi:hypothetical protein
MPLSEPAVEKLAPYYTYAGKRRPKTHPLRLHADVVTG